MTILVNPRESRCACFARGAPRKPLRGFPESSGFARKYVFFARKSLKTMRLPPEMWLVVAVVVAAAVVADEDNFRPKVTHIKLDEVLQADTRSSENGSPDPVILELREAKAAASSASLHHPSSISVDLAMRVFDSVGSCDSNAISRGRAAYHFLASLAGTDSFSDAFRKRPIHIKTEDVVASAVHVQHMAVDGDAMHSEGCSNWVSKLFTLENLISGVDGTVIVGQRTGNSVRDGSKADRWETNGLIAGAASGTSNNEPLQRTSRADILEALRDGTIFFNHAMLGFPTLAALSTLMTEAFGLPSNLNVYATPPNLNVSVPPHTDGQDVLILQTEGKKRWRVFDMPRPVNPYKESKAPPDPFSRGKRGDVLTRKELGQPLLDIVLKEGDVLYVPAGFPHATSTYGKDQDGHSVFTKSSVHLTVGLDTNVWGLSYAHLRSMILKQSGLSSIIGGSVTKFDEMAARDSARPLPIGFLAPRGSNGEVVSGNVKDLLCLNAKFRREGDGRRPGSAAGGALQDGVARYVGNFIAQLKESIVRLEPNRWIGGVSGQVTPVTSETGREGLPSLDRFMEVAEFVLCSHLPAILDAQDAALANVKLKDPAYQRKMQYYSKIQKQITNRFTAFVESKSKESIEGESKEGSENGPPSDEGVGGGRWTQDDLIFILLILAAAVIGVPAVIDLVKDHFCVQMRRGMVSKGSKEKRA